MRSIMLVGGTGGLRWSDGAAGALAGASPANERAAQVVRSGSNADLGARERARRDARAREVARCELRRVEASDRASGDRHACERACKTVNAVVQQPAGFRKAIAASVALVVYRRRWHMRRSTTTRSTSSTRTRSALIRDTVREFVTTRVMPTIGKHWSAGTFPQRARAGVRRAGPARAILTGYGCAGLSDDRLRARSAGARARRLGHSLVREVQGSLVMYPIHAFGSEEQKQRYLPEMAAGERSAASA